MSSASSELPSVELPRDELIAKLARRLSQPLPGRKAQALLEPDAAYGRHFGPPSFDVRPAAVLVLLYQRAGAWHVALTVRHADLATHAGQISLPGGLIEPGETAQTAAERELWEEVGVARDQLTGLGPLSPVNLFSTHFFVQPWVACAAAAPRFRLNESEVAELLEVPVASLLDAQCIGRHRRAVRGIVNEVPHYTIGPRQLWGATAMILSEFLVVYREALRD